MASLAVAVAPQDVEVVRVRDEIVHAASIQGLMQSWRKARRPEALWHHFHKTNGRQPASSLPDGSPAIRHPQAIATAASDESFAERSTTEAKWVKVKPKDRKCNTSKPRQGWTKSQMRLYTVRMCVCCRGLFPREVREGVARRRRTRAPAAGCGHRFASQSNPRRGFADPLSLSPLPSAIVSLNS